jgi:hypothetical protein
MSKFGLYYGSKPSQVYEGKELVRDGEFISVLDENGDITASVRLQPGQSVRKMTDGEVAEHEAPHVSRTHSMSRGGPQSWME